MKHTFYYQTVPTMVHGFYKGTHVITTDQHDSDDIDELTDLARRVIAQQGLVPVSDIRIIKVESE